MRARRLTPPRHRKPVASLGRSIRDDHSRNAKRGEWQIHSPVEIFETRHIGAVLREFGEVKPKSPTVALFAQRFLDAFPDDDPRWPAILAAMEATFGKQAFRPRDLRAAPGNHYGVRA